MGQKVNPTGFRTGVMIGWKSRWFASKQEFADLLYEDQRLREYIKKKKDAQGRTKYPAIAKIEIERTRDEVKVMLFTARISHRLMRRGRGACKATAPNSLPAGCRASRPVGPEKLSRRRSRTGSRPCRS